MRPLCIDLYAGLGGWSWGFLAEGWNCIGFDLERHVYGTHRYPAQLVLQDVRTLHGSQFADAQMIVASSPCQEFSYRAMPWKRAKALGPPVLGMELFAQAERIQREASEAAGHHIPMVQENVKGAQPWVGRAQWHYGSYYLWGDVPALMPITMSVEGTKTVGHANIRDGHGHTRHLTNQGESDAIKNEGGSWFNVAHNTMSGKGKNPVSLGDGVKAGDRCIEGCGSLSGFTGSKSSARKAASALISMIPFRLAQYIAQVYKPDAARAVEEGTTPNG